MWKEKNVDLEIALDLINSIFIEKVERELRPPEIIIFRGTWQGMTYDQMAQSSSYSANYLMRDIAPKFWKLLSELLGESIGKTNLRLAIKKRQSDLPLPHYPANSNSYRESQFWPSTASKPELWGNAPKDTSFFYGYNRELETTQEWLTSNSCRLLCLWGLSGVGKTRLMTQLARRVRDKYQLVIWRSLDAAPSLEVLLRDILSHGFGLVESNSQNLLSRTVQQLQARSCLLLLDGIEAILQPQALSGKFLPGYENYGEFLRVVGTSSHQSCLVFSSLENPNSLIHADSPSVIRTLKLTGLNLADASSLLERDGVGRNGATSQLVEYYRGNPGMLNAVNRVIQELFNGNIQEFLGQKSLVFGEIDRLLSKSFDRLAVLEQEILYWLAGEMQPMSFAEIKNSIPFSVYPAELIEALESLNQRGLVETSQVENRSVFLLSPMMGEFVANKFLAQIRNNFSLSNRQNSLVAAKIIDLGTTEKQPVCLSQWLEHNFELGWQPLEALFVSSSRSPARLKSAFNLRGKETLGRCKPIVLGEESAVLLVAIEREESAIKVCVQGQPSPDKQVLPADLQLKLQDETEKVLATISATARDNFIQLPYFRGLAGERFRIVATLGDASHREDFVL